ncbi:Peptidyl-prolyl cis-trans isomerase-like 4 [Trichinella sp. T9]|nr:Peptidyl-prolyl cis-trans isomerase-like 4 [Trichinella sp. T9]
MIVVINHPLGLPDIGSETDAAHIKKRFEMMVQCSLSVAVFGFALTETRGKHERFLSGTSTWEFTSSTTLRKNAWKSSTAQKLWSIAFRLSSSKFEFKWQPDDLRFVFQEFGKVLNIEMIVGNLLVNDICYAIIEFDSIKSAEKAVYAMNEGVLDNRLVTVEMIPQADTAENAERHKRHRM